MQIVVMRTMGFRQAAQLESAMGSIQLRGLAVASIVMDLLTGVACQITVMVYRRTIEDNHGFRNSYRDW